MVSLSHVRGMFHLPRVGMKSCDGLAFRVVQHEELLRGVAAGVKEDRLLSSGVLSI